MDNNAKADDSIIIGGTVLIVDDIPENLQVLGNVLLQHGFDVGFATDGMQALETVEFNKPDLILLDIMMPGMDGYEVCRRLKANPDTAEIPIIFLTAKSQTEDVVLGFEGGAVDYITKPFNANELIARASTHLEIKKSRDLIKKQNDELKILNASKDKFFSIISHDLKGPYSGLLGLTNMIVAEPETYTFEEVIEIVQKLNQALKNQYSLIENLLQWARIQTNRLEISPEKFDLIRLVGDVKQNLKNMADNKSVKLVSMTTEKATCYADKFMLQSVIHNLTTNAIKFSYPNSEIHYLVEEAPEFYKLTIRDFGIGIKEENLDKLFRIDSHFSVLGTNNEKGTGLGLILVKEMVEKNGGSIEVKSEYGKGCDFTILIKKAESI
jgi:CheY-like chemotaxis protein/two-component sensor histidine kinase